MQKLLSGNEAIAQGAWEAGVRVGVGYPGTPSTETLENLSTYDDVYCEWSPNEKVALEVALGSAMGGARSLVTVSYTHLLKGREMRVLERLAHLVLIAPRRALAEQALERQPP